MFFALNLKICRILRFTIRSYDLRSHLPSTIPHRIPILTTLVVGCIIILEVIFFKNNSSKFLHLIIKSFLSFIALYYSIVVIINVVVIIDKVKLYFSITFMLAVIHNKFVVNSMILYLCILWDLL